jgi:hypothetical protein
MTRDESVWRRMCLVLGFGVEDRRNIFGKFEGCR